MVIKKLKDLCIGKGEYGIAASGEDYSPNKYRYLRITDIDDFGHLLFNDRKSISCSGCEKYLLQNDEIVFARTGNSTGRAFFYESTYGPLVYAGFLIKFHLDRNKVKPKYLKYYTISNTYKSWVANGPTGSTRGNMSEGDFADMPVFLPDREEQDKIVELMTPIDSKIANNNAICADLENMAKLLYDYWFVQFDFPDENGKPYKSSGGKMVWNEELKREIPEGWEVKQFGDIFTFSKGKIPAELSDKQTTDADSPYITIDVANGSFPQYCRSKSMIACNGETIMVMDGAASGDVYIGNVGSLGSTFSMLSSKRRDVSNSLIYMLLKENMIAYKRANTGSTVPHANKTFIEGMKIALPISCTNISKKFDLIISKQIHLRDENQQLASLRDFLLPMLMNGQVKVGG